MRRGQGVLRGERDLDALFQELESLSCGEGEESGQDIDSISIGSTPKPSLRPFFNSKQDNVLGELRLKNMLMCVDLLRNICICFMIFYRSRTRRGEGGGECALKLNLC